MTTMTTYADGYGRRDPVPACDLFTHEIEIPCPCCKGAGEHGFGAGMDTDSVSCEFCDGSGVSEAKVGPV